MAGKIIATVDVADKLSTPRKINGVAFDGTGDITLMDSPNKPIISGQVGDSGNITGPGLIPFNEFWVQQGITYSAATRRFIVPVAGIYLILFNPFFPDTSAANRVMVGVNTDVPTQGTGHKGHTYKSGNTYGTGTINSIVSLAAGDYITFYIKEGALYNVSANDRFNQFSIVKIA